MENYKIRAHHGMCLAYYEGKGYSDGFTSHMGKMKEILQNNPEVTIVACTDQICSHCPNNEEGNCNSFDKVKTYDQKVLALCELEENTTLPFLTFDKMVREKILVVGKRKEICYDCQWNKICENYEQ